MIDYETFGDDEEESRSGLEEGSENHFLTYVAPYVDLFPDCVDVDSLETEDSANDAWVVAQIPLVWDHHCVWCSWSHNGNDTSTSAVRSLRPTPQKFTSCSSILAYAPEGLKLHYFSRRFLVRAIVFRSTGILNDDISRNVIFRMYCRYCS